MARASWLWGEEKGAVSQVDCPNPRNSAGGTQCEVKPRERMKGRKDWRDRGGGRWFWSLWEVRTAGRGPDSMGTHPAGPGSTRRLGETKEEASGLQAA